MGFIRRDIYFVHVLIWLQVQEAYACTIHSVVTDQHIFAQSCMNVVTVVCQMHAYTHLAFKELNNGSFHI